MSVYYLNTAEASEDKTETQCVEDQSQTQSEAQNVLNQFWPKALEDIKAIRNVSLLKCFAHVPTYTLLDGFETASLAPRQDQKNHEIR
jgi:hypothetical protein